MWDIVLEIIMVYSVILSWIKGKDQVLTCMHEENLYNRIGNSTEENLYSFLVLFSYILYFLCLIENWIFNKIISYNITLEILGNYLSKKDDIVSIQSPNQRYGILKVAAIVTQNRKKHTFEMSISPSHGIDKYAHVSHYMMR